MLTKWLRSTDTAYPTASEIRARLTDLEQRLTGITRQRDDIALDALQDAEFKVGWKRLDAEGDDLNGQIRLMKTALQAAEAREAEAVQRAAVEERARRLEQFLQTSQEAQRRVDDVLMRLVNGTELTWARDLRDRLHSEATFLSAWFSDVRVRRPLDPLHQIRSALLHRLQRIERGVMRKGDPITVDDAPTDSARGAHA